MEAKLLRYYKKKIYGGKSIAARAIDFFMLRSVVFFVIFIIILYLSLSLYVSLIIALFLTIAFSVSVSLHSRKKIEKFIAADMLRIKQKCLLEELTFMDKKAYVEFISSIVGQNIVLPKYDKEGFSGVFGETALYAFQNHPTSESGAKDILRVYREQKSDKILIISLSEFSDDAKKMCSSLSDKITLMDGKDILDAANKKGLLPDEQEAEENAAKEMNDAVVTFEKLRKNALSGTKIKGYIYCGIVIMCWPLVAGFEVYYPIIAVICFILAIITYKKSKSQGSESGGIGIS